MRAYALVELGENEALDVFLRREDAFAVLRDALHDDVHRMRRSRRFLVLT